MACSEFIAHGSSKLPCETCGELWYRHVGGEPARLCNCDQSLALAKRLEIHTTLLRGLREACESDNVDALSWIRAMVKLADHNLKELDK